MGESKMKWLSIFPIILLLVLAFYVVDISDRVSILDLHEKIEPGLFGIIWTLAGVIIVFGLSRITRRSNKLD